MDKPTLKGYIDFYDDYKGYFNGTCYLEAEFDAEFEIRGFNVVPDEFIEYFGTTC